MREKNILMEVPLSAMPRERLEHYGEKALSTHELLAILLRTGSKELNVLQLSLLVLNTFEDLYSLKMASLDELTKIHGIGRTKAIEIKAMIELGIRVSESNQVKMGTLSSSQVAGKIIQKELKDEYQEHLLALFLNTKNEIIKKKTIYRGGLNSSIAHPREIFREAVRFSAAKIIIGHNHPSGNLEPSEADINFTKRMCECSHMMGIDFLDHFIVGSNGFQSLRELGYISD
ncbi:RadC family protein [Granulicatella seriolae]|uniref:DNA repair protein RadC n=1 Tax=Granulicatella seriolae TaxID=2967226 RepID=A0ABT1WQ10_9LACT|nr:DNA repair protein RadC [Granulicatella seriolae]